MEAKDLKSTPQSPFDGIVRAARRTVVPRHHYPGMIHQKIVPTGIAALMIGRSKRLRIIGRGQHPKITLPHGSTEIPLLTLEGNHRNQPYIGMAGPQRQDRFGRRQVETRGHTAQKCPESPGIKVLERQRQRLAGLIAVGAMARESNAVSGIEHHGTKDTSLARTLQPFPLNSKTSATMKNTGIVIVSLVGGLIIGSALTMLFTPQSGPELRRKIKETLDDEIERVKNKLSEVEQQIEEARCRCNEE